VDPGNRENQKETVNFRSGQGGCGVFFGELENIKSKAVKQVKNPRGETLRSAEVSMWNRRNDVCDLFLGLFRIKGVDD